MSDLPRAVQNGMSQAEYDTWMFLADKPALDEPYTYAIKQVDLTRLIRSIQEKSNSVDRFEVIDHRQCVYCRGRMTANYAQKDGSYKEMPCDKCDGSGTRGGRVYGAFSNAETSQIKIDLSYQDDDRTLKVFVSDK